MSIESMESSLGRRYDGPFVPCAVAGWRRTWDVAMPNTVFYTDTPTGRLYPEKILYLNVRRDSGTLLNGILFVIRRADLDVFDRREWIYTREQVTGELRGAVVEGGSGYLYVGRSEHLVRGVNSPRRAAIRASYLSILEAGFERLGEGFRAAYERSSDQVPHHLVIDDRRDARETVTSMES